MLMNKFFIHSLFTCCATIALSACDSVTHPDNSLAVATWNIEHLAENNGQGCKARSEADYKKLKAYASNLNADIVALQEVESAKAVARVFPEKEWQIIISDRPDSQTYTCRESGLTSTQQKVAFVVRNSVKIDSVEQLKAIAAPRAGLRQGIKLTIQHEDEKLHIVNLHLKSGCFVDDYLDSDKESCAVLSQQIKILDNYLESQQLNQENWIVLGDFNHRLANPNNRFRKDLFHSPGLFGDKSFPNNQLQNLTDGKTGCHPKYPAPIDHIFVSSALSTKYNSESLKFHYFDNMNIDDMLSDHCASSAHFTF
ncbi:MAG: endonuclease [Pseudoalteromonas sp.]|nr:endonuclease [Pseudoalteromonas sp.]|tara:strand:+ start:483 stop:1415 length:933 start_codon:yes stop_codon:yes gene_type:complete